MIRVLEKAIDRYEGALDIVVLGGWQVFCSIAFLAVLAGQIRSCVSSSPKKVDAAPVETSPFDSSLETHQKLGDALVKVSRENNLDAIQIVVVKSDEINAASMGNGRYILWEGLASLPYPTIEAVLAHECAHDQLSHSQHLHDIHDFSRFWTELIGDLGQADTSTSEIINGWGRDLVVPKYSKAQELEADERAIEILRELGYEHPEEVFAAALETLLTRYGDTGGQFTDSHPATSERIRAVRSTIGK